MDILMWSAILVLSLAWLIKSADIFTESAEKIGLYFGLSSFIIWATIVAVGWSLPELMTSIFWVLNWNSSFAIDNIIGSNITNVLLVWWISAIAVWTLRVRASLIDVDLPLFFISSALFIAFIWDWIFTWKEGIISLILLVIFVTYSIKSHTKKWDTVSVEDKVSRPKRIEAKWLLFILLWIAWIFVWAKYTIVSVEKLATIMNIPTSIITIIAVALGTSLPELTISVKAALKWKHWIALWNIFWSNTFNALAVTAIPSFFWTLTVSDSVREHWILFFIIASMAFLFTTSDSSIQKWEWMALLVIYIAFVGKLVGLV